MLHLPYLTADIPGIGGIIKENHEDFHVEEIPLYLPCGDGEHLYLQVEKRGVTTLEAIRRLSRALNIHEREVGYAGMKDARGVTVQYLSFPRVAADAALSLEIPGLRILSAERHRNKLKLGHLKGNRFVITVREAAPDAAATAEKVLAVLQAHGVPNYFGEQRYGALGNSHLIGRAMLRGDWRNAVDALMGDPEAIRDERWRSAVLSYRSGDVEAALDQFPPPCRTEREVLRRLVSQPDDLRRAFGAVHPRLKKLYLSAWQSSLFDAVVAARLSSLDSLQDGDIAFIHEKGSCFLVTDAAAEQERCGRQEISPTGPLFGKKMLQPQGEQLALESRILAAEGFASPADIRFPEGLALDGERRPLRVPLSGYTVAAETGALVLSFSLPKGSYATTVLRELMKVSEIPADPQ